MPSKGMRSIAINSPEYNKFHTIPKHTETLLSAKYRHHGNETDYARFLELLVQGMDRSMQRELEARLSKQVRATYAQHPELIKKKNALTHLREKLKQEATEATKEQIATLEEEMAMIEEGIAQYRAEYQAAMTEQMESSISILLEILDDPAAKARYEAGFNGGMETAPEDVPYVAKRIFNGGEPLDRENLPVSKRYLILAIKTLESVAPELLGASSVIEETWGKERSTQRFANMQLLERFKEAGFDEASPEWQLVFLMRLRNTAKQHMLSPIERLLEKYNTRNPIGFMDPETNKKRILERLLIGNPTIRNGNHKHLEEEVNGTEFYRGYVDRIDTVIEQMLSKLPSEQIRNVLIAINALAFFRTSNLPHEARASDIWDRIITQLKDENYDAAAAQVKEIIKEYPSILPEELWPKSLSKEEVDTKQQELARLKQMAEIERAEEQERLKAQRQAQRYEQKLRIQESIRSPQLFPAIKSIIGQTIYDNEGRESRILRIDVKGMKVLDSSGKPKLVQMNGHAVREITEHNKRTHLTYPTVGGVIARLAKGKWTIEGVNETEEQWRAFVQEHLKDVDAQVIADVEEKFDVDLHIS